MPPDGYSTVTISDDVAGKLARIMSRHDLSSNAEAVEYTADATLMHDDDITLRELIQSLVNQLDEVDESDLP